MAELNPGPYQRLSTNACAIVSISAAVAALTMPAHDAPSASITSIDRGTAPAPNSCSTTLMSNKCTNRV